MEEDASCTIKELSARDGRLRSVLGVRTCFIRLVSSPPIDLHSMDCAEHFRLIGSQVDIERWGPYPRGIPGLSVNSRSFCELLIALTNVTLSTEASLLLSIVLIHLKLVSLKKGFSIPNLCY